MDVLRLKQKALPDLSSPRLGVSDFLTVTILLILQCFSALLTLTMATGVKERIANLAPRDTSPFCENYQQKSIVFFFKQGKQLRMYYRYRLMIIH